MPSTRGEGTGESGARPIGEVVDAIQVSRVGVGPGRIVHREDRLWVWGDVEVVTEVGHGVGLPRGRGALAEIGELAIPRVVAEEVKGRILEP